MMALVMVYIMRTVNVYFTLYKAVESDKAEIFATDTVLGEDPTEVKDKSLKQVPKLKTSDTGIHIYKLQVAEDLSYDTTHNISNAVNDGICNGIPCLLNTIQYYDVQCPLLSCLWVLFPNIGRDTRNKYKHFYTQQKCTNWTPIWAIKRTYQYRNKAVVRHQYSL